MFCHSCGKQIEDSAEFCVYCGAKVKTPLQDQTSQQQFSNNQQQNFQAAPHQNPSFSQTSPVQQATYTVNVNAVVPPQSFPHPNSEGLLCAAFVLNLITTIVMGFLLIPLAWMIPMTVHSYGIWKGKKPNTIAFGVCTLIFLNLISGILQLCSDKDKKKLLIH